MEEEKEQVTTWEKLAVVVVFGLLSLYAMNNGNSEAAAGYAGIITTYFLSRSGT